MSKQYIDYDNIIDFLNLIRSCDYGGLLTFQTDKEFEASQLTINIIKDRINELKKNKQSIGVADDLAIVYTLENKNPEKLTFWLERATDNTLNNWEIVQEKNPIINKLISFIVHQDRYNNITNKEKFLI